PQRLLGSLRQRAQLQPAEHVAPAHARLHHEVIHAVAVLSLEPLQAGGLVQHVEIAALEVLDEGQLAGLAVAQVADYARDRVQARVLRSAVTPLAGDDLEGALVFASGSGTHEDRRDHALLLHARDQLLVTLVVEPRARIALAHAEALERDQTGVLQGRRL